jgi:hypothetical protein
MKSFRLSKEVTEVKSKVVHVLKYLIVKTLGVLKVKLHGFLNSALYEQEWSASHSGRISQGKRVIGILRIQVGLCTVSERNSSVVENRTPVDQPIANHLPKLFRLLFLVPTICV